MSILSNHRKAIFSAVVIFLLLFLSVGNSLMPLASVDSNQPVQSEPPSTQYYQPTVEPQMVGVPREPIPAQVIIQFAPNTDAKERAAYIQSVGGTVVKQISSLDTIVISVSEDMAQAPLPESPVVAETEPDYYVSALDDVIPNDPRYAEQWALPAIGAPSAWGQMPAVTPKVTVAVIDSGICASHPDLAGRILDGWDFLESDTVPQDDFGHGCSVAGVIAANMNDGIGIAGVAPNAQIMPLRVLNASGVGSYSDVAAAIVYAADNGAEVINLSLGGSNPSSTLENAVNYAISKGVILVAAAGNNGTESALYPAAYPDVIAVGSLDSNLQHSSFSNYGSQIDIWAPGRGILTTKRDSSYGLVSGTSFAAPYVTGAESVYIALNKSLLFRENILSMIYQEKVIVPTIEIPATEGARTPTLTEQVEDPKTPTQAPSDGSIIVLNPKNASDYVNVQALPSWSSNCARSNQSACLPPVLTVSDLPAGWQSIVTTAAQTWSNVGTNFRFDNVNAISQDMRLITLFTDPVQRLAAGEVRVMLATQLPADYYPGRDAVASTRPISEPTDSSKYLAALIVLNDIDYSFGSGGQDLQYIMTHEFGHVLGLPDIYNPLYWSDVMYFTTGSVKRELSDHDKQGVIDNYGPISPLASPQSPNLLAPPSNNVGGAVRPFFDWGTVNGAQSYYFQLSKNRKFANGGGGDNSVVQNIEVSSSDAQLPFDLEPNTKYYWRVKASNFGNNSNWSSIWQFTTTSGTPADGIPPIGLWSSPNNSSTISSSLVTLSVNASDNTGGSGVREVRWSAKWGGNWYYLGNDVSSPYSMSWNMCNSGVPNGNVELGLEVWDNANNKWVYSEHYSNYQITKNYPCTTSSNDTTPPTGSWTSPGNGQTITSRTITLGANASDNSAGSGVKEVHFNALFNGQWQGVNIDYTYPYTFEWDMCNSNVPNGDVELGLEVYDNAGNPWIYSQHFTNYHITKNYNCGGNNGGGNPISGTYWNMQAWMNKYLAGYVNYETQIIWDNGNWPYINFDWGTDGPPFPGYPSHDNEFSVRLWRNVYFPGGQYEFKVNADDAIRIYVDNQLLIDRWWDGSGGGDGGKYVSQGNHEIKVEYYENQGDARLWVVWYGPGYPAPDNNPPDGRITSPAHLSATSSTSLNISADAWDDASGVDHVEFTAWYCYQDVCDWRYLGSDSVSPYTYSWNWGYLPDLHVWLNLDVIDKTGKRRSSSAGWVEVDLDRGKPTASINSPTSNSYINANSISINVNTNDNQSGIWKVQFFAGYNETTGTGAQGEIAPPLPITPEELQNTTSSEITAQDYWHEIGWDTDGSNGWNFTWNAASNPDQGGASIFVYAYDKAGNYQGAQNWPIMLDRVAPFSAVNALPIYIGSTSFTVSWTGSDVTSGIGSYDIQYQDNGNDWISWLNGTSPASATFYGEFGHTYAFRSQAHDRAGNAEGWPTSPDAQTTIVITPSNNNFGSAIQFTTVPFNHAVDTRGATMAVDDPAPTCGYGKNSNSVWYKYIAPANGILETGTFGSDFDTVITIWKGAQGSLTQIACNDDSFGYLESWLEEIPVTTNTTYYIEVMDYGNPGGGNLELYVGFAQSVSNNDFNSPLVINSNPFNTSLNTQGATQASDDPTLTNCNRLPGQASVWYRYIPAESGKLHLDTKGSEYDTLLAVWTGTRGDITPIGCNDDIGYVGENWDSDSMLDVPVNAGTNYFIEVSTYNGKIDINGASAQDANEKPGDPSNSLSPAELQGLKKQLDDGVDVLSDLQEKELSPQFWGGQMQLHTEFFAYPATPALSSPNNDSTLGRSELVTLSFNPVNGASQYYVEFWGGPGISINSDWISETSWNIGNQWGGVYHWRVKAKNAVGLESSWSPTQTLTVKLGTPLNFSVSLITESQAKLSWDASADAPGNIDGYKIFKNGTLIGSNDNSTTEYSLDIVCGMQNNFTVQAYKDDLTSDVSRTSLVLKCQAPALISPIQDEHLLLLQPTLDWNDIPSTNLYLVQISQYEDFSRILREEWTDTSEYTPLEDLPPHTTLYWRVRVGREHGLNLWSDTRSFSTPNPPSVPVLISPNPDSTIMDNLPLFKWSQVIVPRGTDFSHYQIQVSTDQAFSTLTIDENISGPLAKMYSPELGLIPNTTYYWRMRAFNTSDEASSWTEIRPFTTPRPVDSTKTRIASVDSTIQLPEILTPSNETAVDTLQPVLDWKDVTGATNYIVQVSIDQAFSPSAIVVTATTVESQYVFIKDAPSATVLYWRILSIEGDIISNWSEIYQFTLP